MARSAIVVYWYPEKDCPRDGGGIRALAWLDALRDMGFEARMESIHPEGPSQGTTSRLTKLKRVAAPMPLSRQMVVPDVDLVVVTVPGVFRSVGLHSPAPVVFDWMDRWSTNAWTMGLSSPWSTIGGALQSALWRFREPRLAKLSAVNTFAGYKDLSDLGAEDDLWLPSPAKTGLLAARSPRRVRTVGFLGNLHYEPNEFSLRWFLRRYEKALSAAGIRIVIAGFGSERVRGWQTKAEVLGPVDDVSEFYDGIDAAVVPIKHGGGIKVKALEALAHGVPVICSRETLEGFAPELIGPSSILLEDFIASPEQELHVGNVHQLREAFSQGEFVRRVRRSIGPLFD